LALQRFTNILTLQDIICKIQPLNNWNGGQYGTGM